jgi:membrane-bound serine protease (ClpP class)
MNFNFLKSFAIRHMIRAFAFLALGGHAVFLPAVCRAGDVLVLNVTDAISPGTADTIQQAIQKAGREKAGCLIIVLDTPGGLAESMRDIVKAMYESPVAVVVFVSPSGARAASAGVMITLAADIAAMAPGTNIGAAHPVGVGGGNVEGPMADKVVNDMVAQVKSIAAQRGRNAEWAEKAVRESAAVTEAEALDLKVIDLVAKDIDDLIAQINGRQVAGKGRLDLDGARQKVLEEGIRSRILKIISDPNIAYILLMIGLAGLYFELAHPGAVFPGVVGGMALVMAFYSLKTLPVNVAGILMILLALVFFILEMKITSYGLLSLAGIGSLLMGSLMLFEGSRVALSLQVLIGTVGVAGGFFAIVAALVFKAQTGQARTGESGLMGQIGSVKVALNPEGKVFVHGELWAARADTAIEAGQKVRVVGVNGLVLQVEAIASVKP